MTKPRPAAEWVTAGLVFLVLAGIVLTYGAVESIVNGPYGSGSGVMLAGAVGLVVAVVVLAVGVRRLVEHADRAAGVRVEQDDPA